jgi:hypothetical protein
MRISIDAEVMPTLWIARENNCFEVHHLKRVPEKIWTAQLIDYNVAI